MREPSDMWTISTPDAILAKLSAALHEYELELNGEKTSLHGLGFPHAPEWGHFVRNFAVSSRASQQRDDLDSFFEQAIYLADANPRDNVLLFAAKRSASFDILDENWNHLIQWFLYIARRSTTCLSFVSQHLSTAHTEARPLPIEQIGEFIHRQTALRAEAAHTAEVSWLLFWARELNIAMEASKFERVLKLRSSVCALLIFDMMQRGLINGSIDTSFWKSFTNGDGLKSEMWLAAYEIAKKGWWLPAADIGYITSHHFFSELWNRGVEFYEPKRRSRPQVGRSFFEMVASLSAGAVQSEYPH